MAVPIRRKIPGKAFQYTVIGLLIAGGVLSGLALTFIVALDGWNQGDELILIMGSGIVPFFVISALALKGTWDEREQLARAEDRPVPDEI